jgi:hypothetical protein
MNPSKTYLRQEMRKYLSTVPDASPEEIADLKIWVAQGNDPYGNPWHIADEHGRRCNTFALSVRSMISLKKLSWDD